MKKKIDFVKIIVIALVMAILMSAISITIYSTVAQPEFYNKFMSLGNQYLEQEMYEEAVIEFNKAIVIEEKSTEARVGVAKGSIGLDDVDTAVRVLKEAQDIDSRNKDLLIEIIDILKDADPNAAYEILMKYVEIIGEGNLDADVRGLLDSSKELPIIPNIVPWSGAYVQPFSLKLESDSIRIGHVFYYTTDGTYPDENANMYRGGIAVDEDVNIRIIGYNPNGDSTEIVDLSYVIDPTEKTKLENMARDARAEMESTEVGTEVGNCIEGAKEALLPYIEAAEALLEQRIISVEEAVNASTALNDAWYIFKMNIIVPTDRTALEAEIEKAQNIVNNAKEGRAVGQYRTGSKAFLTAAIEEAKAVLENLVARQEVIDDTTASLKNSIRNFESQKLTQDDIVIDDSGARVGQVTVSLLWDTIDDVDLHVSAPNGETIYYGNRSGSSGGVLDVDRQVGSYVDHPVENIYWANAPHGNYTVKVNVFTKRTNGSIPMRVRTIVGGQTKWYDFSLSSGTTTVCSFSY